MERTVIEAVEANERKELGELLSERAKYTRVRKDAEEMERACTAAIIPILQRMDIKSIDADDDQGGRHRFLIVNGANSSVDRKMLLMKGVDPGVIDECTKQTKFVTLQMRDIKDAQ